MIKKAILNIKGEKIEEIELDSILFDGKVNEPLLYQVIKMYLANKRKGNASTKTKGEVRGGGKKPWRQKGTGRARAGSIRSPLWRGGGVTFGPKPRDYSYKLPKKMRKLALKSSLNAKLRDDEILFLDKLELDKSKTKEFFQILKNLKLDSKKSLFILADISKNIRLSARNIPYVSIEEAKDVTAYDVLNYHFVVISQKALKSLIDRIKDGR
jgi:large subunit ribosomal protein L4